MTASAPKRAVIVGAGIIGLSTAWFLQEHGVEVTVLDQVGVAAGSSWGNAGWLAPALTTPLPEPAALRYGLSAMFSPSSPVYLPLRADPNLARFLVSFVRHSTNRIWQRSMRVFADLSQAALDAYSALTLGGVAAVVRDADPFIVGLGSERALRAFVTEIHHVRDAGVHVEFDLLSGDAARWVEPALGPGVAGAVRLTGQRFINPGEFLHGLADSVLSRGGKIATGVKVTAVREVNHGIAVESGSDELHGDVAVLATGAALNTLARPFGVRQLVQAGRGYSFSIPLDQVPSGPIYFPDIRVACTPLGDQLRIAGTMEFRRPDEPLDRRRIDAIVKATRHRLTGAHWTELTSEWVGSRPCTADGLPLIGRTRSRNVHVAGGHGMWGIALGPLTGRLVADSIACGQTPHALHVFNPLR